MKVLSILLSSSGGGEVFFVGAITGLIMWGLTSLFNKASSSRQDKKDEVSLKFLKENIVDKGGLPIVLNELFEYLENRLNLDKFKDFRSILTASNDQYEVTFMVFGNEYDRMSIDIINKFKNKSLKWRFELSDSQEDMISTIESDISAKGWE